MNTFTSHVSALLPQLAAGEHRTPGTLPSTASPTRGGIPQRLRPRRRIASRASPARQAKDTSRACPSPAHRRIPISGHKIPILTTGYLPPPLGICRPLGRRLPQHSHGPRHKDVSIRILLRAQTRHDSMLRVLRKRGSARQQPPRPLRVKRRRHEIPRPGTRPRRRS